MSNKINHLRQFGKFRLDAEKRVLWCENEPVNLPLKEIELLCVLTENGGEVVTKDELLNKVWADSFVEESNLSRHIYMLRKTFKDFGEERELIQTVPRRGYRFAGEVRQIGNGNGGFVIEKHTQTRTLIEEIDNSVEPKPSDLKSPTYRKRTTRWRLAILVIAVILTTAFGIYLYNRNLNKTTVNQPIKSIAVLPLKPFAANAANEELRLQITDAVITRLGGLKDVAVRPTAAVLRFSKSEQSIFEIGKKLQVDAILDGRVQQEGERVRVTLQLVAVSGNEQIWSEQFDGDANRILNLQDAISAKVLQTLNQNRQQTLKFAARPTENAEAYEAYLKGRFFVSRINGKELLKGIGYYQQAVQLDRQFAEAYAQMAEAQFRLYASGFNTNRENVAQAKENLQRALIIKPDLAEALVVSGFVQMSFDWDWENAEKTLKKATEIAPNSLSGRLRYGLLLTTLRRFDEAQTQFEQAVKLYPIYPGSLTNLGLVYFYKKDFARAEQQFRKAIEMDDKWDQAHWYLSRCLWLQGKKAESIEYLVNGLNLNGNEALARKIEEKSRTSEPDDVVRMLINEWEANPATTNSFSIACRSMSVGEREKALFWLEKSVEEHHPFALGISASPDLEPLRNEPRFLEILGKMNLQ